MIHYILYNVECKGTFNLVPKLFGDWLENTVRSTCKHVEREQRHLSKWNGIRAFPNIVIRFSFHEAEPYFVIICVCEAKQIVMQWPISTVLWQATTHSLKHYVYSLYSLYQVASALRICTETVNCCHIRLIDFHWSIVSTALLFAVALQRRWQQQPYLLPFMLHLGNILLFIQNVAANVTENYE